MGFLGKKTAVIGSLLLAATLLRLVPHPPNFSPMVAVALLSGTCLGGSLWAFVLPAGAWFATDGLLELATGHGFHSNMPAVYLSMLAIVGLGSWLRPMRRGRDLILASLGSSTLFYIVTNFSVWATGSLYPHSLFGLWACYVAALPFYGLSLLGDLTFSVLLFGTYRVVVKHVLQHARA